MITQDQLKEVQSRVEQLNHYLNIPAKKIQYEEEQLRTQKSRLIVRAAQLTH